MLLIIIIVHKVYILVNCYGKKQYFLDIKLCLANSSELNILSMIYKASKLQRQGTNPHMWDSWVLRVFLKSLFIKS